MSRLSRIVLAAVVALLAAGPAAAAFPETDVFVASAGNGPGAGDSHWYTTLWIQNPTGRPQSG